MPRFTRGPTRRSRSSKRRAFRGKFEPVLAALPNSSRNGRTTTSPIWRRHGREDAGLDIERGKRDAARPDFQTTLKKDAVDVKALEVTRTPTFFVNGQPLTEFGPRPLYEMVKREVEKARK